MSQALTAAAIAFLAATTVAHGQSLVTSPTSNNGRSDNGAGAFFDLTAISPVQITGIEYFAQAGAGTATTVEIWTHPGTYVGNDGSSTGWVLHDTVPAVAGGTTVLAPVVFNLPLEIPAGTSIGIYIVTLNGGIRYDGTNTAPPQMNYSNADLEFFGERARGGPPWTGPLFTPRTFAGVIHYQVGATGCYANCDGSTVEPVLNVDDFTCFINEFASAQSLPHEQQVTHYANCDGSTVVPALNVDDFTCFINEYAQGCP